MRRQLLQSLREMKRVTDPITVDLEDPWAEDFLSPDQERILDALASAYWPVRDIIDRDNRVYRWDRSEARRVALYAIAGVACISIGLRRRDAWKIVHAR